MTSDAQNHINEIRRNKYSLDENGRLQGENPLASDLQDSITHLSEGLYSSDAHFIFELIQNAEDNIYQADQPSLSLKLTKIDPTGTKDSSGALIFQNNETGFSSENINAICAVGKSTKSKAQGYIGEKGIGFKSVFRITSTPHILSNSYRFCLPEYDAETKLGFIVPVWVEKNIGEIDSNQTTIILPLDKEEFNYEKVETMLRDIEPETILFLSKLKRLAIFTDSGDDISITKDDSKNPLIQVSVEGKRAGKSVSEIYEFLVYPKRFSVPQHVTHEKRNKITDRVVTIAYPIKDNESFGKMFAYLPIKAKSNLPFLINADFILTSSRETIQEEVHWNKWLIECVAEMIGETLDELKKHKYLSVDFLEKIVDGVSNLNEKNFVFPIVVAIRDAFRTKELLPSDEGSYIAAKNAKLADVKWLHNLVQDEQFMQFKSPEKLNWISGEITDAKRDLWNYLQKEINIELITAEKFINRVDSSFFEKQTDDWLIKFYKEIKDSKSLWRKLSSEYYDDTGILLAKAFIRLEDGSHIKPFDGKDAKAYLPSESITDTTLPIVKISIANDKEARQFLKDLGIPNYDVTEEVIRYIIPKYSPPSSFISLDEHKRDIDKILQAHRTDSQEKKQRLVKKLLETTFVLTRNQTSENIYRKPLETYIFSTDLEIYFYENFSIGFASPEYGDEILGMLKELGVSESVRVSKQTSPYGYIFMRSSHGDHARGLNGFDPDIKVDGLEHALASPSIQKSAFIWNYIVIPNQNCILGTIEKSSRQDFPPSYYDEHKRSKYFHKRSKYFGHILIENAWLPDLNGKMHKPSELTLDELPVEFTRDESLAQIFLKKKEVLPEPKDSMREQALNVIAGGDFEKKKRIEEFTSLSDDMQEKILKTIPHETLSESAPSFKEGLNSLERPQRGVITHGGRDEISAVSDVERYQEKLNDQVEEGIEEHKSTPRKNKFSLVKEKPSNAEARSFLYEEYQGQCQVTGTTFPKAGKNADGMAENYFEACSLLSYESADYLNDAGNMICVSADTRAKLKNASHVFLDEIEDVIRTFKEHDGNMESVSVKVLLAGEECSITWSQRHFMRLVALYEKA